MLQEVQIVRMCLAQKQLKYTGVPKQAASHGVSKRQIRCGVHFPASVCRLRRIIRLPRSPLTLTERLQEGILLRVLMRGFLPCSDGLTLR